jgi:hypothetical protein
MPIAEDIPMLGSISLPATDAFRSLEQNLKIERSWLKN